VGNNDSEKAELASLVAGQLAVPKNSGLKAGLVSSVPTSDFWRDTAVSPGAYNHFWNQNAESYYLIGESMGHAMLKLTKTQL
jgi:alpha-galactosidase